MGAFIERGVDLSDGRAVDSAGRVGVRGRPSSGANVGVPFLKFPLDAVAIDGVEKADPFDDFANRLLNTRRVGDRVGKFDVARLDRADENRPILRRIVDQVHGVEGFHMREHFVDVGDPEANVSRPANVVRLAGGDLLPAGRAVKRDQFQKQILGPTQWNLQKTNAHIDGFRVFQKTGRPREPHIPEVPQGLLNARIEESLIKACRLFEIGHNDIDVAQRIK
jgi:hypothetical protein